MKLTRITQRFKAIGLMTVAAAACLVHGMPMATADSADPYLGVWNYDQPDRADSTNIATAGKFGLNPLTYPQIGTVDFERAANGDLTGHTDQGCTWHFRPSGDGLDLTSTDQYCYNNVIGSGYNIYYWHVTVQGDREQEVIRANSYLPYGTFDFVLADGKRTRAAAADPGEAARSLTGTWAYDATNPLYLNNLTTPGFQPKSGTVTLTATAGDRLVARTDDGCDWTLAAHGNTAELAPAHQVCGAASMSFWSIAGDGQQLASIMTGIDAQGHDYFLSSGSMHR
ncbi:hypothetical protein [Nocardia sp. NPDC020380]|uniref:hypothetical protein n=1 Tax=Nocardia sp. NPDC020380 TaxID=3364309 RepID=UPI0037ABC0CF